MAVPDPPPGPPLPKRPSMISFAVPFTSADPAAVALPASPPLILPMPPPPPTRSAPIRAAFPPPTQVTVQRSYSYASSFQSSTTDEPQIDDLKRDTNEVKEAVQEVVKGLKDIEALRDTVITARSGSAGQYLHQLAALTTTTGIKMLELSTTLAAVKRRTERLSTFVSEGKAAATEQEVAAVAEELEVVALECKNALEVVQQYADEELQELPRTLERLGRHIRAENPTMSEELVTQAVQQAQQGASLGRVAKLDIFSYAGRLAAECPFTELALIVATIRGKARKEYGDNRGTFLEAEPAGQSAYDKLDHEIDLENAPLAAGAGASFDEWSILEKPAKLSLIQRMKANWRDWLVRGFVSFSVTALILGLVIWQIVLASKSPGSADYATSPSRLASATVLKRL